jgi:dephospho-CoA kinase
VLGKREKITNRETNNMKQYFLRGSMKAIRIAITGGIGSGKSTVLNLIQELGYPVFSCDEIYRVLRKSEDYLLGLKELFPQIFVNNSADFKKLSQIVFNDKNELVLKTQCSFPIMPSISYTHKF